MRRAARVWSSSDPLAEYGICSYSNPYTTQDISDFNVLLDPLFKSRVGEARSYVHIDELNELGLLSRILSPAMRNILFSMMPDPVFFHCLVNEIAGNDTHSHFGAERLSGWHCDSDSMLVPDEVTHVSIFTYLTDVGPQEGAFEFSPKRPSILNGRDPSVLATGQAGFTFAWQRSFFHRASPNYGPRRRRLLKLSVQRNRFPSHHLSSPHFRAAIAAIPPGDTGMDVLLGRYQDSEAPPIVRVDTPLPVAMQPTGTINISNVQLLSEQLLESLRYRLRQVKRAGTKRQQQPPPAAETY